MNNYTRWFKSSLFVLVAFFGMSTAAFADLNTSMAVSGGYVPGGTSTVTIDMSINSGTVEYASLVTITLPAGWTGVFSGGVGAGNCNAGDGVVCQEGGNVLIIGDPTCAPDDGCGPYGNGTHTIAIDVTVPAGTTGTQNISWTVDGDGFNCGACSCGAWTCDTGSFNLEAIVCEITCPADVVASTDAGVCEGCIDVAQPTVTDDCIGVPADFTDYGPATAPLLSNVPGGTLITSPVTIAGIPTSSPGNVMIFGSWNTDNGAAVEATDLFGEDGTTYVATLEFGGGDCTSQDWGPYEISVADYNNWAADGQITFFTDNNTAVNFFCAVDEVTVNLSVPATVINFTNDYNGTTDASDCYPRGTTEVTWTTSDAHW